MIASWTPKAKAFWSLLAVLMLADCSTKRLAVYHEQTEPLVEYYAALGLLRRVDGEGTPGEVFAAVLDALGAVPA